MKVLRYLKPYWLFALLCPLAMILEVSMDLLQPTLMSDIVDNGILGNAAADENLRYVLITGLKMLVFSLVGGIRHGGGSENGQRFKKRRFCKGNAYVFSTDG